MLKTLLLLDKQGLELPGAVESEDCHDSGPGPEVAMEALLQDRSFKYINDYL